MTDLRTRTLRLLLAGALAVGVASTTTTVGALSVHQGPTATPTAEPAPQPDGDDPLPADEDCDPEVQLCAVPVDPVDDDDPGPECPEIPTAGGPSIPDPGCDPCPEPGSAAQLVPEDCRPPECPEVLARAGDEPAIDEIDPDCLPCPLDEQLEPVRTDPERRREDRRTDPCDPPVDVCEELEEDGPRVRSGDDDVVELRLERADDGRDDCEPDTPNFTG